MEEIFDPYVGTKYHDQIIWDFDGDGQMEQRGTYPSLKSVSDHEGLSKADIDGDDLQDIVGGGYWFKDIRNDAFSNSMVDTTFTFNRSVARQIIKRRGP
jgi:hypothetical protein